MYTNQTQAYNIHSYNNVGIKYNKILVTKALSKYKMHIK